MNVEKPNYVVIVMESVLSDKLFQALVQLQKNKIYIGKTENELNDGLRDMLNMVMNPTAEQMKEMNENPEALAADRTVGENQSAAFSKIYRYDGQKSAYRPSVRKEIDSILNQGNNVVDMEVVTRRESLKSRLSPYSAVNDDLYNDDAFKMVAEAIDSYQIQNGMEVSR